MTRYEYKVEPAPNKGRKFPGVKGPEARFAMTLQDLMNEMAAEGWEYQRADILPSEERQGLTSSHTVYRSVLVFRRPLPIDAAAQGHAEAGADNTGDAAPVQPDEATRPDAAENPKQEPHETGQSGTQQSDDSQEPRER